MAFVRFRQSAVIQPPESVRTIETWATLFQDIVPSDGVEYVQIIGRKNLISQIIRVKTRVGLSTQMQYISNRFGST
jgi:hypothetical protein